MPELHRSYLIVQAAERTLALPVEQVVEICRMPPLAPGGADIPGLLGLVELRGAPTAVFDLAQMLHLSRSKITAAPPQHNPAAVSAARLVTVRMGAARAALLVDHVIGVREIPQDAVHSIALPGDRTKQVGEFDREFARLVDASGLVADDRLQQIAGAAR